MVRAIFISIYLEYIIEKPKLAMNRAFTAELSFHSTLVMFLFYPLVSVKSEIKIII